VNARVAIRNAFNFFGGLVARTVIDNNDFDFAFVVRRKKCAQSFRDHFSFIVGSDHYTDGLRKICFRSASETISKPDDNQRANDYKRGRDDHERPEEFLDTMIDAKTGAAHET